jgi:AcrR family transcriptional regulator
VSTAPSDELIAATASVVDAHGVGGVTGELIAEAAGLNRVTLYRRGHTPQALLLAAAQAAAGRFREAALGPLTDSGTAAERLDLLLEVLFEFADGHLALLAGLYDGPSAVFHLGGDEPGDALEAVSRLEYTEPFERLLRDGDADGTVACADPRGDAELIFNAAGWTYIHLRRSHHWAPERARSDVRRIVNGLVQPRAVT